jgi:hypothetical protein
MNKDVIPFIPASFGSFMGLVFTFGVLGIVIHVVQLYQIWCWQVLMAMAGQKRWNRKIRVPRLKMLQFHWNYFLGQPTTKLRETWSSMVFEYKALYNKIRSR